MITPWTWCCSAVSVLGEGWGWNVKGGAGFFKCGAVSWVGLDL